MRVSAPTLLNRCLKRDAGSAGKCATDIDALVCEHFLSAVYCFEDERQVVERVSQ